jgi:hypothetical protein
MILKEYNISPDQIRIDPKMVAKPMGLEAEDLQEPYKGMIHHGLTEIAHYKSIREDTGSSSESDWTKQKTPLQRKASPLIPGNKSFAT